MYKKSNSNEEYQANCKLHDEHQRKMRKWVAENSTPVMAEVPKDIQIVILDWIITDGMTDDDIRTIVGQVINLILSAQEPNELGWLDNSFEYIAEALTALGKPELMVKL